MNSLFDPVLIAFCGFFSLIWGLGQSLAGSKKFLLSGTLVVLLSGIRLLWESGMPGGFWLGDSLNFPLVLPFLYGIGPSLYFYFLRITHQANSAKIFFHIIPIIIAAFGFPFWLGAEEVTRQKLIEGIPLLPSTFMQKLFILWIIGPKLSILSYLLAIPILNKWEIFRTVSNLSFNMRFYVYCLYLLIFFTVILDCVGYIFSLVSIFRVMALLHGFAVIFTFLFSYYNPQSVSEIQVAIQNLRYGKSKITGIDIRGKLKELEIKMKKEKYFADEDLRISHLAGECGLNTHQLSELINRELGISFTEFVNRYRVEEAAELLKVEPDRSVLSIAIAVGFNSKSSFHLAFSKRYAMTPTEYRKKVNYRSSEL